MLVFVCYDISENYNRTQLIKHLQHFGLHRIQKSIFICHLSLDEIEDISQDMDGFLSSDNDSIIIIPLYEKSKNLVITISYEDISIDRNMDFEIV